MKVSKLDQNGRSLIHNWCDSKNQLLYQDKDTFLGAFSLVMSFLHSFMLNSAQNTSSAMTLKNIMNAKDNNGMTPIQISIHTQNRDAMIILLLYGYTYGLLNTMLDWNDGFQAMILFWTCKKGYCCRNKHRRSYMKQLLSATPTLMGGMLPEYARSILLHHVQCFQEERLLQTCFQDNLTLEYFDI